MLRIMFKLQTSEKLPLYFCSVMDWTADGSGFLPTGLLRTVSGGHANSYSTDPVLFSEWKRRHYPKRHISLQAICMLTEKKITVNYYRPLNSKYIDTKRIMINWKKGHYHTLSAFLSPNIRLLKCT